MDDLFARSISVESCLNALFHRTFTFRTISRMSAYISPALGEYSLSKSARLANQITRFELLDYHSIAILFLSITCIFLVGSKAFKIAQIIHAWQSLFMAVLVNEAMSFSSRNKLLSFIFGTKDLMFLKDYRR